jgi:hypothetical protein
MEDYLQGSSVLTLAAPAAALAPAPAAAGSTRCAMGAPDECVEA